MSTDPKGKDLLSDVLSEEESPDFRAALLSSTLRRARRRRLVRWAQKTAGSLALFCILGMVAWLHLSREQLVAQRLPRKYEIVNTQPLPAAAIVRTYVLAIDRRVTSVTVASVVRSTSKAFRTIDDNQLFALLAPRPSVLVSVGPNSKILVFVNQADEEGFRLN